MPVGLERWRRAKNVPFTSTFPFQAKIRHFLEGYTLDIKQSNSLNIWQKQDRANYISHGRNLCTCQLSIVFLLVIYFTMQCEQSRVLSKEEYCSYVKLEEWR